MSEPQHDKKQDVRTEDGDARRARLEQELRANLLKRKAQSRTRKGAITPREEGGQIQG
jgi:hypothetical protein